MARGLHLSLRIREASGWLSCQCSRLPEVPVFNSARSGNQLMICTVPSIISLSSSQYRRNELPHTIYWKILISIFKGMSGYVIYIFHKKKWLNCLQTVETLIICHIMQCLHICHILRCLIWICTVCQLPF